MRRAWRGGLAGIAAAMLFVFTLTFTRSLSRSFSFCRRFRVDALRSRMSHRICAAVWATLLLTAARLCQLRHGHDGEAPMISTVESVVAALGWMGLGTARSSGPRRPQRLGLQRSQASLDGP